jgi:hypothetical protein
MKYGPVALYRPSSIQRLMKFCVCLCTKDGRGNRQLPFASLSLLFLLRFYEVCFDGNAIRQKCVKRDIERGRTWLVGLNRSFRNSETLLILVFYSPVHSVPLHKGAVCDSCSISMLSLYVKGKTKIKSWKFMGSGFSSGDNKSHKSDVGLNLKERSGTPKFY